MFEISVSAYDLEELEDKYNVSLHVETKNYIDGSSIDKIYLKKNGGYVMLGYTVEQAEATLEEMFDVENEDI